MKPNLKDIFSGQIYGITCFETSCGRGNKYVVQEMLKAGIRIIQYREKFRAKRIRYEECCWLRKITREYNALFIINDDVDFAILCEADGVHIGQDDLSLKKVRKLIKPDQFIGLSTHNPKQAKEALRIGADYIGVGPIYPTQTKKNTIQAEGLDYIRYVSQNIDLPFVAIGGIKEHNIAEALEAGARCVSLVTEITEARNIQQKIKNIQINFVNQRCEI
ncbi:thiamine phosphate synthase [bacterium]|nr:thiamine phosphate synthase [bacterium]